VFDAKATGVARFDGDESAYGAHLAELEAHRRAEEEARIRARTKFWRQYKHDNVAATKAMTREERQAALDEAFGKHPNLRQRHDSSLLAGYKCGGFNKWADECAAIMWCRDRFDDYFGVDRVRTLIITIFLDFTSGMRFTH
jgi:hypothetical protein